MVQNKTGGTKHKTEEDGYRTPLQGTSQTSLNSTGSRKNQKTKLKTFSSTKVASIESIKVTDHVMPSGPIEKIAKTHRSSRKSTDSVEDQTTPAETPDMRIMYKGNDDPMIRLDSALDAKSSLENKRIQQSSYESDGDLQAPSEDKASTDDLKCVISAADLKALEEIPAGVKDQKSSNDQRNRLENDYNQAEFGEPFSKDANKVGPLVCTVGQMMLQDGLGECMDSNQKQAFIMALTKDNIGGSITIEHPEGQLKPDHQKICEVDKFPEKRIDQMFHDESEDHVLSSQGIDDQFVLLEHASDLQCLEMIDGCKESGKSVHDAKSSIQSTAAEELPQVEHIEHAEHKNIQRWQISEVAADQQTLSDSNLEKTFFHRKTKRHRNHSKSAHHIRRKHNKNGDEHCILSVEAQAKFPEGTVVQTKLPKGVEVQTKFPKGAEVQIEFPECMDVQTRFPQGTEVQTKLPDSAEVQTKSPQGIDIHSNLPEGEEIQTELPEGTEVQIKFLVGAEVETKFPQATEVQTKLPEGVEVQTKFSQGTEYHTTFPEGAEVQTGFPEGAEVQTKFPEHIEVHTNFPEGAEVHTTFPEDVEVQTKFPEGEKIQSKFPENKEVHTNFPESAEVQTKFPEGTVVQTKFPESMEVHTTFPEDTEVQTKFLESVEVQTKFREGAEVQMKLPECPEVPTKFPEGAEVPTKFPEGTEVQTKLLEGVEVLTIQGTEDHTTFPEGAVVPSKFLESVEVQTKFPKAAEIQTKLPECPEVQTTFPEGAEVQTKLPDSIFLEGTEVQTTFSQGTEDHTTFSQGTEDHTTFPEDAVVQIKLPEGVEVQTKFPHGTEVQTKLPDSAEVQTKFFETAEVQNTHAQYQKECTANVNDQHKYVEAEALIDPTMESAIKAAGLLRDHKAIIALANGSHDQGNIHQSTVYQNKSDTVVEQDMSSDNIQKQISHSFGSNETKDMEMRDNCEKHSNEIDNAVKPVTIQCDAKTYFTGCDESIDQNKSTENAGDKENSYDTGIDRKANEASLLESRADQETIPGAPEASERFPDNINDNSQSIKGDRNKQFQQEPVVSQTGMAETTDVLNTHSESTVCSKKQFDSEWDQKTNDIEAEGSEKLPETAHDQSIDSESDKMQSLESGTHYTMSAAAEFEKSNAQKQYMQGGDMPVKVVADGTHMQQLKYIVDQDTTMQDLSKCTMDTNESQCSRTEQLSGNVVIHYSPDGTCEQAGTIDAQTTHSESAVCFEEHFDSGYDQRTNNARTEEPEKLPEIAQNQQVAFKRDGQLLESQIHYTIPTEQLNMNTDCVQEGDIVFKVGGDGTHQLECIEDHRVTAERMDDLAKCTLSTDNLNRPLGIKTEQASDSVVIAGSPDGACEQGIPTVSFCMTSLDVNLDQKCGIDGDQDLGGTQHEAKFTGIEVGQSGAVSEEHNMSIVDDPVMSSEGKCDQMESTNNGIQQSCGSDFVQEEIASEGDGAKDHPDSACEQQKSIECNIMEPSHLELDQNIDIKALITEIKALAEHPNNANDQQWLNACKYKTTTDPNPDGKSDERIDDEVKHADEEMMEVEASTHQSHLSECVINQTSTLQPMNDQPMCPDLKEGSTGVRESEHCNSVNDQKTLKECLYSTTDPNPEKISGERIDDEVKHADEEMMEVEASTHQTHLLECIIEQKSTLQSMNDQPTCPDLKEVSAGIRSSEQHCSSEHDQKTLNGCDYAKSDSNPEITKGKMSEDQREHAENVQNAVTSTHQMHQLEFVVDQRTLQSMNDQPLCPDLKEVSTWIGDSEKHHIGANDQHKLKEGDCKAVTIPNLDQTSAERIENHGKNADMIVLEEMKNVETVIHQMQPLKSGTNEGIALESTNDKPLCTEIDENLNESHNTQTDEKAAASGMEVPEKSDETYTQHKLFAVCKDSDLNQKNLESVTAPVMQTEDTPKEVMLVEISGNQLYLKDQNNVEESKYQSPHSESTTDCNVMLNNGSKEQPNSEDDYKRSSADNNKDLHDSNQTQKRSFEMADDQIDHPSQFQFMTSDKEINESANRDVCQKVSVDGDESCIKHIEGILDQGNSADDTMKHKHQQDNGMAQMMGFESIENQIMHSEIAVDIRTTLHDSEMHQKITSEVSEDFTDGEKKAFTKIEGSHTNEDKVESGVNHLSTIQMMENQKKQFEVANEKKPIYSTACQNMAITMDEHSELRTAPDHFVPVECTGDQRLMLGPDSDDIQIKDRVEANAQNQQPSMEFDSMLDTESVENINNLKEKITEKQEINILDTRCHFTAEMAKSLKMHAESANDDTKRLDQKMGLEDVDSVMQPRSLHELSTFTDDHTNQLQNGIVQSTAIDQTNYPESTDDYTDGRVADNQAISLSPAINQKYTSDDTKDKSESKEHQNVPTSDAANLVNHLESDLVQQMVTQHLCHETISDTFKSPVCIVIKELEVERSKVENVNLPTEHHVDQVLRLEIDGDHRGLENLEKLSGVSKSGVDYGTNTEKSEQYTLKHPPEQINDHLKPLGPGGDQRSNNIHSKHAQNLKKPRKSPVDKKIPTTGQAATIERIKEQSKPLKIPPYQRKHAETLQSQQNPPQMVQNQIIISANAGDDKPQPLESRIEASDQKRSIMQNEEQSRSSEVATSQKKPLHYGSDRQTSSVETGTLKNHTQYRKVPIKSLLHHVKPSDIDTAESSTVQVCEAPTKDSECVPCYTESVEHAKDYIEPRQTMVEKQGFDATSICMSTPFNNTPVQNTSIGRQDDCILPLGIEQKSADTARNQSIHLNTLQYQANHSISFQQTEPECIFDRVGKSATDAELNKSPEILNGFVEAGDPSVSQVITAKRVEAQVTQSTCGQEITTNGPKEPPLFESAVSDALDHLLCPEPAHNQTETINRTLPLTVEGSVLDNELAEKLPRVAICDQQHPDSCPDQTIDEVHGDQTKTTDSENELQPITEENPYHTPEKHQPFHSGQEPGSAFEKVERLLAGCESAQDWSNPTTLENNQIMPPKCIVNQTMVVQKRKKLKKRAKSANDVRNLPESGIQVQISDIRRQLDTEVNTELFKQPVEHTPYTNSPATQAISTQSAQDHKITCTPHHVEQDSCNNETEDSTPIAAEEKSTPPENTTEQQVNTQDLIPIRNVIVNEMTQKPELASDLPKSIDISEQPFASRNDPGKSLDYNADQEASIHDSVSSSYVKEIYQQASIDDCSVKEIAKYEIAKPKRVEEETMHQDGPKDSFRSKETNVDESLLKHTENSTTERTEQEAICLDGSNDGVRSKEASNQEQQHESGIVETSCDEVQSLSSGFEKNSVTNVDDSLLKRTENSRTERTEQEAICLDGSNDGVRSKEASNQELKYESGMLKTFEKNCVANADESLLKHTENSRIERTEQEAIYLDGSNDGVKEASTQKQKYESCMLKTAEDSLEQRNVVETSRDETQSLPSGFENNSVTNVDESLLKHTENSRTVRTEQEAIHLDGSNDGVRLNEAYNQEQQHESGMLKSAAEKCFECTLEHRRVVESSCNQTQPLYYGSENNSAANVNESLLKDSENTHRELTIRSEVNQTKSIKKSRENHKIGKIARDMKMSLKEMSLVQTGGHEFQPGSATDQEKSSKSIKKSRENRKLAKSVHDLKKPVPSVSYNMSLEQSLGYKSHLEAAHDQVNSTLTTSSEQGKEAFPVGDQRSDEEIGHKVVQSYKRHLEAAHDQVNSTLTTSSEQGKEAFPVGDQRSDEEIGHKVVQSYKSHLEAAHDQVNSTLTTSSEQGKEAFPVGGQRSDEGIGHKVVQSNTLRSHSKSQMNYSNDVPDQSIYIETQTAPTDTGLKHQQLESTNSHTQSLESRANQTRTTIKRTVHKKRAKSAGELKKPVKKLNLIEQGKSSKTQPQDMQVQKGSIEDTVDNKNLNNLHSEPQPIDVVESLLKSRNSDQNKMKLTPRGAANATKCEETEYQTPQTESKQDDVNNQSQPIQRSDSQTEMLHSKPEHKSTIDMVESLSKSLSTQHQMLDNAAIAEFQEPPDQSTCIEYTQHPMKSSSDCEGDTDNNERTGSQETQQKGTHDNKLDRSSPAYESTQGNPIQSSESQTGMLSSRPEQRSTIDMVEFLLKSLNTVQCQTMMSDEGTNRVNNIENSSDEATPLKNDKQLDIAPGSGRKSSMQSSDSQIEMIHSQRSTVDMVEFLLQSLNSVQCQTMISDEGTNGIYNIEKTSDEATPPKNDKQPDVAPLDCGSGCMTTMQSSDSPIEMVHSTPEHRSTVDMVELLLKSLSTTAQHQKKSCEEDASDQTKTPAYSTPTFVTEKPLKNSFSNDQQGALDSSNVQLGPLEITINHIKAFKEIENMQDKEISTESKVNYTGLANQAESRDQAVFSDHTPNAPESIFNQTEGSSEGKTPDVSTDPLGITLHIIETIERTADQQRDHKCLDNEKCDPNPVEERHANSVVLEQKQPDRKRRYTGAGKGKHLVCVPYEGKRFGSGVSVGTQLTGDTPLGSGVDVGKELTGETPLGSGVDVGKELTGETPLGSGVDVGKELDEGKELIVKTPFVSMVDVRKEHVREEPLGSGVDIKKKLFEEKTPSSGMNAEKPLTIEKPLGSGVDMVKEHGKDQHLSGKIEVRGDIDERKQFGAISKEESHVDSAAGDDNSRAGKRKDPDSPKNEERVLFSKPLDSSSEHADSHRMQRYLASVSDPRLDHKYIENLMKPYLSSKTKGQQRTAHDYLPLAAQANDFDPAEGKRKQNDPEKSNEQRVATAVNDQNNHKEVAVGTNHPDSTVREQQHLESTTLNHPDPAKGDQAYLSPATMERKTVPSGQQSKTGQDTKPIVKEHESMDSEARSGGPQNVLSPNRKPTINQQKPMDSLAGNDMPLDSSATGTKHTVKKQMLSTGNGHQLDSLTTSARKMTNDEISFYSTAMGTVDAQSEQTHLDSAAEVGRHPDSASKEIRTPYYSEHHGGAGKRVPQRSNEVQTKPVSGIGEWNRFDVGNPAKPMENTRGIRRLSEPSHVAPNSAGMKRNIHVGVDPNDAEDLWGHHASIATPTESIDVGIPHDTASNDPKELRAYPLLEYSSSSIQTVCWDFIVEGVSIINLYPTETNYNGCSNTRRASN